MLICLIHFYCKLSSINNTTVVGKLQDDPMQCNSKTEIVIPLKQGIKFFDSECCTKTRRTNKQLVGSLLLPSLSFCGLHLPSRTQNSAKIPFFRSEIMMLLLFQEEEKGKKLRMMMRGRMRRDRDGKDTRRSRSFASSQRIIWSRSPAPLLLALAPLTGLFLTQSLPESPGDSRRHTNLKHESGRRCN